LQLEQWIRWALLTAWSVFAIALLVWWWRRRFRSLKYSYPERAVAIKKAIDESSDLAIVYWSKKGRRFLRRIVSPLELDGYSLKAFDHTVNDVRIFQVTRIKTFEIIAPGTEKLPSFKSALSPNWLLVGLGVVAIALLAFALYRGFGTTERTASAPPPELPDNEEESSSVSTTNTVAGPTSAVAEASVAATQQVAVEVVRPSPPPKVATSLRSQDRWELVIYDQAAYDTNYVAKVLQRLLNSTPADSGELVRKIRAQGQARVWEGRWTQAEILRQTFDAEGISARLQPLQPQEPPGLPR
jgi:hypothetical protein